MARTPRRRTICVILTVACLIGLAVPGGAQDAPEVASSATPSPAIPESPLGDQLNWVLAQLNGGASTLSETDIEARFARSFLVTFPAPLILELLQQTADQYAPITFTGFVYPPTATGAKALVETGTGQ